MTGVRKVRYLSVIRFRSGSSFRWKLRGPNKTSSGIPFPCLTLYRYAHEVAPLNNPDQQVATAIQSVGRAPDEFTVSLHGLSALGLPQALARSQKGHWQAHRRTQHRQVGEFDGIHGTVTLGRNVTPSKVEFNTTYARGKITG